MLQTIAEGIIILFGGFFIGAGFLMLLKPEKARATLRKAGSTVFINYAELSIRMIPGFAFIIYSKDSEYPLAFQIVGWFMILSSIVLMVIPRRLHHQFSLTAAEMIKPIYFQLISPVSIFIGIVLIFIILKIHY